MRRLPLTLLFVSLNASAQSFTFNINDYVDVSQFLTPSITKAVVQTVGLAADQRPYEPATPLGNQIGLHVGIEATLAQLPQSFIDALRSAGYNEPLNYTFIPLPRLHVHKGIGNRIDFGVSYLGIESYEIWGFDLKFVFYKPPEGLTWAFRLKYTDTNIGFVRTFGLTPELVVSRKMEFADPYLAIAYQMISGRISLDPSVTGLPVSLSAVEATSRTYSAYLGVQFKFPILGLLLSLEGGYNSAGVNTIGTKVGIGL